jgi:hypothetical protein
MGSGIEFTIKLKPYLQEWVFNSVMKEPPKASLNDMFGWIVYPYLKRYEADTNPKFYKGPEWFRFEFVNITSNGIDVVKGNYCIPERYHRCIERVLYLAFERELFRYLKDKVRYVDGDNYRGQIQKCIIQWCLDNQLTFENNNYEMLKKKFYRIRKREEKREKVSIKVSLKSPLIF